MPVSIFAAFQAQSFFPALTLPQKESVLALGVVLTVSGLILRWYAIYRLGRWFTVDVALSTGQVLMRDGPYRVIRHPSYTGALLVLAGAGVLMGNAGSILLVTLPALAAFLYRIRIEEHALAHAFGPEWKDYCAKSWRLIPKLY
ncbi:isoprenylcysteine carboxyl methyltransferase [Neokomagataea thailandica NBRC 106555]|uniref:Isoprenylcysteine carboxyl methyltransferase n=1 Tax=Neokomagataea thailandica NBRC 106555 TaxID=1223520 RepID=A0ABQ0QQU1_9PROT|nr:isoprenylcysteine carboxyl methyltransferase [Neokomagataea thailandica NBRC 106555]